MKIDYGKYENQIDYIPNIAIYSHYNWDFEKDKKVYHFHISIQCINRYVEVTMGKDEM